MEAKLRVSVPTELSKFPCLDSFRCVKHLMERNALQMHSSHFFPTKQISIGQSPYIHTLPVVRSETCLNCSLQRPWWSIKRNLTDCVHEPGRLPAIPCTPIPSVKTTSKCCVFTGTYRSAKFFKRFRSTQIQLCWTWLKWLRLSYWKVSHQLPWSMAGCTKHNSHKC